MGSTSRMSRSHHPRAVVVGYCQKRNARSSPGAVGITQWRNNERRWHRRRGRWRTREDKVEEEEEQGEIRGIACGGWFESNDAHLLQSNVVDTRATTWWWIHRVGCARLVALYQIITINGQCLWQEHQQAASTGILSENGRSHKRWDNIDATRDSTHCHTGHSLTKWFLPFRV